MIDVLKALADENRMRILNLLREKELCVCEIETLLGISQSNTSRHLTKLRQAGIISSYKDAQWVHYKIDDDFKGNNESLMIYLNHQLDKLEPYISDLNRMNRYSDLGLTCTDIRSDSNKVITLLNQ